MNKEISYSGLDFTTAPDLAPDGSLDAALGLLHVDSALCPIHPPQVIATISTLYGNPVSIRGAFIHSHSNGDKYIIICNDDSIYYNIYQHSEQDTPVNDIPTDLAEWAHCSVSLPLEGQIRIDALGNLLIVSTSQSLLRLRWDTDKYTALSSSIPLPKITFALKSKNVRYPDDTTSDIPIYPFNNTTYLNALLGGANSLVARETEKGRFTQPFLARAAFTLFDGTVIPVSAPQLLYPSSEFSPYLNASIAEANSILRGYWQAKSAQLFLSIGKIPDQWNDMIISLDIFVTAPIFTYDQAATDVDDFRSSADSEYNPWYRTGRLCQRSYAATDYGEESFPQPIFSYQYVGASNITDFAWTVPYRSTKDITDEISSKSIFYHIFSIPVSQLPVGDTPLKRPNLGISYFNIIPPEGHLSSLATHRTLTDVSHSTYDTIASASISVYNARLHLANFKLIPTPGFQGPDSFSSHDNYYKAVDRTVIFLHSSSTGNAVIDANPCVQFSANGPLFAFYPNPDAYRVVVFDGNKAYDIPLKTHELLDAAIYMGPFDDSAILPVDADSLKAACTPTEGYYIPKLSTVYVSEVNNPLVFPAQYAISVGSGTVLSLVSAAKALSQGQFGQFPLYAFTTEGVWALEVSATGTYSARQPITRDVCISPEGITQLDSAVLFPTDRGIMLLSGSTSACISDLINTDYPFSPLASLPHAERIADLARLSPDVLDIIPFSKFLADARMLYDYSGQRVILYRPSTPYAYVYSLRSKLWGMMLSDIVSSVNSYPRALAIDSAGNLLDYSAKPDPEASTVGDVVSNRISPTLSRSSASSPMLSSAILITRPLSLDAHDILKTVDTVIQRGHFRRDHVSSILYGSRDLHSWHLIRSSKDHYLRGFRGTPYKYFRIALIARLSPDESISGCSVSFTPRLTNRLR